jgi:hypothetical protein
MQDSEKVILKRQARFLRIVDVKIGNPRCHFHQKATTPVSSDTGLRYECPL